MYDIYYIEVSLYYLMISRGWGVQFTDSYKMTFIALIGMVGTIVRIRSIFLFLYNRLVRAADGTYFTGCHLMEARDWLRDGYVIFHGVGGPIVSTE